MNLYMPLELLQNHLTILIYLNINITQFILIIIQLRILLSLSLFLIIHPYLILHLILYLILILSILIKLLILHIRPSNIYTTILFDFYHQLLPYINSLCFLYQAAILRLKALIDLNNINTKLILS